MPCTFFFQPSRSRVAPIREGKRFIVHGSYNVPGVGQSRWDADQLFDCELHPNPELPGWWSHTFHVSPAASELNVAFWDPTTDSWDNNGYKGRDYHVPIRAGQTQEIAAVQAAARTTFPVEFLWTAAPGSTGVTVSPARDRVLPLARVAGDPGLWAASVEVPAGLEVSFKVAEGGKLFVVGPVRVFGPMRLNAGRLGALRTAPPGGPTADDSARVAR